jgi:hypothetical protein
MMLGGENSKKFEVPGKARKVLSFDEFTAHTDKKLI